MARNRWVPRPVDEEAIELSDSQPEERAALQQPRRPSAASSAFNTDDLDQDFYHSQPCEVQIHDDVADEHGSHLHDNYHWTTTNNTDAASKRLHSMRMRLLKRDLHKSRWINIVGSSGTVYDEVEQAYPGIRPCLDVTRPPAQTYGGPIYTEDGSRFIWLQSQAWFIGHREPVWSSMRQVDVRVIFYLPGPGRAGTLITNFLGKFHLASELSSICSQRLRCDNPIERCSLGCGWVLCFGMLRTLTEQLDFAFELFDPIRGFSEGDLTLKLDSLHVVLEKWANLLQIDRYLSGIEELCLFFTATREFVQEEKAALAESDTSGSRNPDSNRLTVVRADFEAKKALSKINGQQRHCLAYVKRFETLFQLTTSVTAASIAHSVESSKGLGQRFARISLVLTGLAGIVTPVNILTSFYGMNVQEFSPGAAVGLDQFWQVGLPVLLACAVAMGVLVVWMGTSSSQPASGSGKQHGSARSKTSMIPGLDGIVR